MHLARCLGVQHFDFAMAFIAEEPSFSPCPDHDTSLISRVADIIHVTHAMQEHELASFALQSEELRCAPYDGDAALVPGHLAVRVTRVCDFVKVD